ncbi:MAG: exodeoxyribonuclease V subunit beta [Desulfobulbaceae bacterium A2]|nr:MAG: exodeoxyribonuclease V subunit beta [Desulfobulbaceae bacterium A2]
MKEMDLRQIPLRGLHLVEASAGTGKTWAIVRLYVRLLLEDVPATLPLGVDRLLVVTYTNAATEELRGRIRAVLQQALALLDDPAPAAGEAEELLRDLLQRAASSAQARARLREALIRMDEALVTTIHGYCLRALQDNAFESGIPFDFVLQPAEDDLRRRAMEDFWRREVVPLPLTEAAALRGLWHDPVQLLRAVETILSREGVRIVPVDAPAQLEHSERALQGMLERLRQQWPTARPVVEKLLRGGALNARSYTSAVVGRVLEQMEALTTQPGMPEQLPADFSRLTPAALAKAKKKDQEPPTHPCFDLCGAIAELYPRVEQLRRAAWLLRAQEDCRRRLEARKRDERRLHYDDLLLFLARALRGPGGTALAERLRQQAPVALIDEFQDTDPLQWEIFARIYHQQPGCGLFLIGDPKQAIYAFRGADIFSYIRARRATDLDKRHTLGHNWRSHSGLVAAVNRLFSRVPAPFLHASDIPFYPAQAGGKADAGALCIDRRCLTPLQFRLLEAESPDKPLDIGQARQAAAQACADDIVLLLRLGGNGRARLGGRVLGAGDIGVLVRSHMEGALVQRELARRGIASVSLSRASVFASDEARDLALVLTALQRPADELLVRAAWSTPLMGYTMQDLRALTADETAWSQLHERLRDYRARWQQRGFMSAFFALLHGEGLPVRLRRLADGERRLTNLLQLGELLQEAAAAQAAPEGVLRWFAAQRAEPSKDNEAQQLRLENDEQLVRIVTIHKSKGLQYPVVFLPFFCARSAREQTKDILLFHDEALQPCADLGSEELAAHRAQARREESAQEMRLLYVALTRAEQCCVVTWGWVKDAEVSAPARLLHPLREAETGSRLKELGRDGVRQELEELARSSDGCIGLLRAAAPLVEEGGMPPGPAVTAGETPPRPQVFHGHIARDWRVMSYTRLSHDSEVESPERGVPSVEAPGRPAEADAALCLTGGVRLGNCVHALLEQIDFADPDPALLAAAVRRLRPRFGLEASQEQGLVRLVAQVLDTALDEEGSLSLRCLSRADCLRELRFHFSLDRCGPAGLRRALAIDPVWASAAAGLRFEEFRGLMTGSIDLVFRYRGRYHLADYKSNHLGWRLADYAMAGLDEAMRRQRYELQCLIYSVALHRYLQLRLPGYDYERDCGGAWYLFLRGMRPEHGPRFGVWQRCPPRRLVERLDQFFRQGDER